MTERYLHHWSYMSAWVIFFRKTGKLLFSIILFPWTMFPCSPGGFLIPFIPFVPLRKNATSHYETVPFQNRPFLFNWNLLDQKPLPMALLISELLMVLQNKRKAFNRKTFSERLERLIQCSTNVSIYTPGGGINLEHWLKVGKRTQLMNNEWSLFRKCLLRAGKNLPWKSKWSNFIGWNKTVSFTFPRKNFLRGNCTLDILKFLGWNLFKGI